MFFTLPTIYLEVSELSRFVCDPDYTPWDILKVEVNFLKENIDLAIIYAINNGESKFHVYVDSSLSNYIVTWILTTGILENIRGN